VTVQVSGSITFLEIKHHQPKFTLTCQHNLQLSFALQTVWLQLGCLDVARSKGTWNCQAKKCTLLLQARDASKDKLL
jgi:hypothetical protein